MQLQPIQQFFLPFYQPVQLHIMLYLLIVKLLSFFLAFVVLLLSVQPVCAESPASGTCCSVENCDKNETPQTHNEHHDKECNAVCNPFQSCGCCAFCVIVPQQISFIPSPQFSHPALRWVAFTSSIAEATIHGLEKPPRIA